MESRRRSVKDQLAIVTAQTKGERVHTEPFDWRRFSGETVKVWWPTLKTTVFRGIDELLEDFTRDTGIVVENYGKPDVRGGGEKGDDLSQLPDGVALDAYPQSLDYSGFYLAAHGDILPLTGYLTNPSMTAPDFDFGDFMRPIRIAAGFGSADVVYSIPLLFENYLLIYNKGLLEKHLGGRIPRTIPDLLAEAHRITAESRQDAGGVGDIVYGLISRTVGPVGEIDTLTSVVFNALGLHEAPELPWNIWFDGDFLDPTLDDARIKEGIRILGDLLGAGPTPRELDELLSRPGAPDWFNPQLRLFLEGRAVFFLAPTQFAVYCHGPDEGPPGVNPNPPGLLTFDTTGYSLLPPMEAAQPAASGLWTMGWVIPTASENPDLGWYFIQYMSRKQSAAKVGTYHAGAPRKSTWGDRAYLDMISPELVDVVFRSAGVSYLTTVASVQGGSVAHLIERMAEDIWEEKETVDAAARKANTALRELFTPSTS